MSNSRAKRPPRADERATVVAFLQWHRETLALKCAGLTPAQLAEPAMGTSALSLLGLIRHAAESERFWFRQVMAGDANAVCQSARNGDPLSARKRDPFVRRDG